MNNPPAMQDRICLVTGGNSGIGLEAAKVLARQGATILITGRDQPRGETAARALREAGAASVEFIQADLSTMAAVRVLAAEVRRRHDKLHVLVNNAGLICPERRLTNDGLEETFAVNHLATFLLTTELRSLLMDAGSARVVTVASEAHRSLPFLDFDNLQGEKRYRPFRAYSQSKLENILFTYELARRWEGTGVAATCLHPGVVLTPIWRNARGVLGFLVVFIKPFMISAAKGGASVARLACAPGLEGMTGRYYHRDSERRTTPVTYDGTVAARLWDVSETLARR